MMLRMMKGCSERFRIQLITLLMSHASNWGKEKQRSAEGTLHEGLFVL